MTAPSKKPLRAPSGPKTEECGAAEALSPAPPDCGDILDIVTIRVILAAAGALLRAQGRQNTTLDDIAWAAKMPPHAIARYFDSKERLFAAVLRQELRLLLQAIRETYRPEADPIGNLLSAHDAILVFFREYRRLEDFQLLTDAILAQEAQNETGDSGSSVSVLQSDGAENAHQIVTYFQRLLEEGMAQGQFRPMDARRGAILQLGICAGCACPSSFPSYRSQCFVDEGEIRRAFHELIAGGVLSRRT